MRRQPEIGVVGGTFRDSVGVTVSDVSLSTGVDGATLVTAT